MRVFILESCVVQGAVWLGGVEVEVDEAVGMEMVEKGVGREMVELNHRDPRNYAGVEFMVGKRERPNPLPLPFREGEIGERHYGAEDL